MLCTMRSQFHACDECRQEAEQLWQALDAGKEATALKLLQGTEHAKELVFRKHPISSAYAVHAAIDGRMDKLAIALANVERYPGVLQQQDGKGCAASWLAEALML